MVGKSYLEPYLKNAARYIIPAINDLAAALAGKPVSPLDDFQNNRRSLNLVGYEGISMIAASGVDIAAWDALAKGRIGWSGKTGPIQFCKSRSLSKRATSRSRISLGRASNGTRLR